MNYKWNEVQETLKLGEETTEVKERVKNIVGERALQGWAQRQIMTISDSELKSYSEGKGWTKGWSEGSSQKQVASENNLALRYTIEGRYKGSQGTGISLGAINVPRGSVKVTANGVVLTEGVDYTVDYMIGQVNIINEMVKQSGQAINVSLENQLTFNTQRKRFLGLNLERKFNENLTIGATVVNYSETLLTQKVS